MKNKFKRMLALLLALSMCFSLMSTGVWAAESEAGADGSSSAVTQGTEEEAPPAESGDKSEEEAPKEEAPAEDKSEEEAPKEEAPAEEPQPVTEETREKVETAVKKGKSVKKAALGVQGVDADTVATIHEATYTSLADAIREADENYIIKLEKTTTLNTSLVVNKKIILDLNGNEIQSSADDGFDVNKGDLTLRDSLTGGKITHTGKDDVAWVRNKGSLTVEGGAISSTSSYGIYISSDAVTISGGVFDLKNLYGDSYTITGGFFTLNPTDFLDITQYKAVLQGDTSEYPNYYKVEPVVAAQRTVSTLAQLKNALSEATDDAPVSVTVAGNIEVNTPLTLGLTSTLTVGEGFTLSIVSGGILYNNGKTINNGTISTSGSAFLTNPSKVINNGTLTGYPDATSGTYIIEEPMDLQWLSYLNKEDAEIDDVVLANDITMPDGVIFDPINYFSETFEGNNHKVNGINLNKKAAIWVCSSWFGMR